MSDLKIHVNSSGYTALFGDHLEALARKYDPSFTRRPASHPLHITLLTKEEARSLSSNPFAGVAVLKDLVDVELGAGGDAQFVVVSLNSAQIVRIKAGLPRKDFHITLHTPPRSSPEDYPHDLSTLLVDPLDADPPRTLLDALSLHHLLHAEYQTAMQVALRAVALYPTSTTSHVRLGDAALKLGCWKLGMPAFGRGWELARRQEEGRVAEYCVRGIAKCARGTEWGCTWTEREEGELEGVKGRMWEGLWTPWSEELREVVGRAAEEMEKPELCLGSRERIRMRSAEGGDYELMRFFRWILPFRLAVSSIPRTEADIAALAHPSLAIRHIVTLSLESPLPPIWFQAHPTIRNTFLHIRDFAAPTLEEINIFIGLVAEACERGEALLVHCAGGKGRAGTMVACWMVAFGFGRPGSEWLYPAMSAGEVMDHLRRIRPGSIESFPQEEIIKSWSKYISKRGSPLPPPPAEPLPSHPIILGILPPASPPDLIVLCGLPGSGKSTFRHLLLLRDAQRWTSASGDEDGGTNAVQQGASTFRPSPTGRKGLILDQVNATVAKRRALLALAQNAKHPTLVWFDFDAEVCEARCQARMGHESLRPGQRVRMAMRQFVREWEEPSLQEGWGAVVKVGSKEAARELVRRWTPHAEGLLKFPRTEHLVDLGAVGEDDLVVQRAPVCREEEVMVVTEKVDGANLGFSLDEEGRVVVQNRSHYVDEKAHPQFRKLGLWIEEHREELFALLGRDERWRGRFILYGEWVAAVHSVRYTSLPDRFLAFDLLDRSTSTFVSRTTLVARLKPTSIHLTPLLYSGSALPLPQLLHLIQQPSAFSSTARGGRMEGVYVKIEGGGVVSSRGKIVRGDIIAGNEHWSKGRIEFNRLEGEGAPREEVELVERVGAVTLGGEE